MLSDVTSSNSYRFLTQTRPHDESLELYETPYLSRRKGACEAPTGSPTKDLQRYPLSTLSLSTPEGSNEPISPPRRRLVKWRTPSPSHSLPRTDLDSPTPAPRLVMNVPDMFTKGKGLAQLEKQKNRLEKSEFVQSEAEESDDDDVLGFLPKKRKDEEEEDNNDLDRTLETLVDDRHMDDETLNAPRVLEKFKLVTTKSSKFNADCVLGKIWSYTTKRWRSCIKLLCRVNFGERDATAGLGWMTATKRATRMKGPARSDAK